jgi:hypothetical protein
MGFEQWMRVVDAVTGLAQFVGRKAGATAEQPGVPASGLGGLETRLAGVVVAALKEAFDRDRVRMDLERAQIDAERRRAEQALEAELRRQAAERALAQLRLIAVMAVGAWMLSAALAIWLPNMRTVVPRVVLGAGWACSFAALGCAFAGGHQASAWTVGTGQAVSAPAPRSGAATSAPWLLLASLGLIGASLLLAL